MRYLVNDQIFDDYHNAVDYCIEDDYHAYDDYFEEWVNETWNSVEINGTDYYPYDILERFGDLDAAKDYYVECQNDSDRDDAIYQLRNAKVGDVIECQSYEIEVIEDTGDFDGDEECNVDNVRQYIEDQKILDAQKKLESEAFEKDLLKMFQVIE